MNFATIQGVDLIGHQIVLPKTEEWNRDLIDLSQEKREKLIQYTGINRRLIAHPNADIKTFFKVAVEQLLAKVNWSKEEIDAIVVVTQNTKNHIPSMACKIQGELDFNTACMAYDLNMGCSGFIYGLHSVGTLLASLKKPTAKAILCCGDLSSQLIDKNDAATAPIFSDAVSASAISYTLDGDTETHFSFETIGKSQSAIYSEGNGSEQVMKLNGMEVFHAALSYAPKQMTTMLNHFNFKTEDISLYFLHQANQLINEAIIKELKVDPSQAPSSLNEFGNTAIASIPLTMNLHLDSKQQHVLCCGFGVGFSVASAIIPTENFQPLEIIYLDQ